MAERPLSAVPVPALVLLAAALAAQVTWHALRPPPVAQATELPPPPPIEWLRLTALGDPVAAMRGLLLWLQAHDNQPGISIPYRSLDYGVLRRWLEASLALDGRSQYPLLAAARLYGEVPVPEKQRLMLDFVHRAFLLDPNRRWPAMAHAVFVAKHRLKDLPLALDYAGALTERATDPAIPEWVRQMRIFVLEDMGEIEAAKIIIGGLLESGRVTDPNELGFLKWRLRMLEEQEAGKR